MSRNSHDYRVRIEWTGNTGEGTRTYTSYRREHTVHIAGKPPLACSSDAAFRGDAARHNPEDLFVASLSSCHMLWYLHLCAVNRIVVLEYADDAGGTMLLAEHGAGKFTRVVLRPAVRIAEGSDPAKAHALHEEAHRYCFIANSVNFPVVTEAPPVTIG